MSQAGRLVSPAAPSYRTTPAGQLRLWSSGLAADRPLLVALAGPTRAAADLAGELVEVAPISGVIVLELPGIGGSAGVAPSSMTAVLDAVAQALAFLSGARFTLVGCELAAALLPGLTQQLTPVATLAVGLDDARAWVASPPQLPLGEPREDGGHLHALWGFLRDRRLLDPEQPTLPRPAGQPLPSTAQLSAAFLDAVKDPAAFVALWRLCAAALAPMDGPITELRDVAALGDAAARGDGTLPTGASGVGSVPATEPGPGIWHQYVTTSEGRIHLRRCGAAGRPLLIFPSAGGSSAPFFPLLEAFGGGWAAAAVDYFGNGLSDAPDRAETTVEQMAADAFAVADALGWEQFDVWGSHTGACLALEMTIQRPDRIGRGVFEAPVFVSPEFHADLMANYFPDFTPHPFGLHLANAWHWRRDMFMYWPWYRGDGEHRRELGVPSAAQLHSWTVGVLESGASWEVAYRAGFSYDTTARLPRLTRPGLLTSGPHDMLANALNDAAALAPDGMLEITATPATLWYPGHTAQAAAQTIATYTAFLERS